MKSTTKRRPRLYLGERGKGSTLDRIDRWIEDRRLRRVVDAALIVVAALAVYAGFVAGVFMFLDWTMGGTR